MTNRGKAESMYSNGSAFNKVLVLNSDSFVMAAGARDSKTNSKSEDFSDEVDEYGDN